MKNLQRVRRWGVGLLLLLAGCANMGAAPSAGEAQDLEPRVRAYWAARESGDDKTVYGMESAARPGGWLTPALASDRGAGLSVSNVEIGVPVVHDDTAEVPVKADLRLAAFPKPVPSAIRDKWVRIDGVWYHLTAK